MFKDNQIIITNNMGKYKILKDNSKKLINLKIYTIKEFMNLFYFSYNEETIYYVKTKYNINSVIAEIYLKNLLYINDTEYKDSKLLFLANLKKELLDKNLIKENNLFVKTLKEKEIIIYNIPLTKEIELLSNYRLMRKNRRLIPKALLKRINI